MFWRLNSYLRPHLGLFMAGIFFVALSNVFSLYPARLISRSLDLVIESLQVYPLVRGSLVESDYYQRAFGLLLFFALLILLMALIKGGFMFLMRQTLIIISRRIEYRMKNQIYAHYQEMDQAFFKRHSTGDLMTRISEDVSHVRNYIGPAIMYSANMIIMFVLVVSMMWSVSPRLTGVVLVPMAVLSVIIYFVNKAILQRSERVQALLSQLTSLVQESFSGIRIIKAFGKEPFFGAAFNDMAGRYRRASLSLSRVDAMLFPVVWLLIGFSMLLALVVGGREIQAGRITPGVIAEFIVYVNMLTWPVASVGWVSSVVQQALVSFRRICEFLDTQPAIRSGIEPAPADVLELEFDNVHFTFPDTGIYALRGVSFHIRKGECLGITGRTGAGKSAILQLIMRFYDPDQGVIRVNGRDIRTYDLRSYRKLFGYVPQEAMLFSDTVEGNILWGRRGEEGRTEAAYAAQQAAVRESVERLPQGFETPVGEKGVRLSGGQKQRLALARALLKKPSVLLMDDSLSAVDYETEKSIREELQKIRSGMILIMTGHRVSAFPPDAHILVLHHGVVTEAGSREQLSGNNGYFANMLKEQKQL